MSGFCFVFEVMVRKSLLSSLSPNSNTRQFVPKFHFASISSSHRVFRVDRIASLPHCVVLPSLFPGLTSVSRSAAHPPRTKHDESQTFGRTGRKVPYVRHLPVDHVLHRCGNPYVHLLSVGHGELVGGLRPGSSSLFLRQGVLERYGENKTKNWVPNKKLKKKVIRTSLLPN